jgi:hypothetical protein
MLSFHFRQKLNIGNKKRLTILRILKTVYNLNGNKSVGHYYLDTAK